MERGYSQYLLGYLSKIIIVTFLFFTLAINFSVNGEQHYIYLAESLLKGQTYFTQSFAPQLDDVVFANGHYYWPETYFPTFLFLPFVYVARLFGQHFLQGYLQFFLTLAIFFLVFKTARKVGFESNDSLLLAFAFCFASAFISLAFYPWVWFFAQVLVVVSLTSALYEYFWGKRRYLLIGLFLGVSIVTRINTVFSLVFFLLAILFLEKGDFWKKVVCSAKLLVFPAAAIIFFAGYNFFSFGSPFTLGNSLGPAGEWPAAARSSGVLSIVHVPRQLYYLFLSSPLLVLNEKTLTTFPPFIRGNPWGMSIFVTSPYLVYFLFVKIRDKIDWFLLFTVLATLVPILFLYSTGARQVGYRYVMDFFPFLFLLFIRGYRRRFGNLSSVFRLLVLFSAIFNLYLFFTVYST